MIYSNRKKRIGRFRRVFLISAVILVIFFLMAGSFPVSAMDNSKYLQEVSFSVVATSRGIADEESVVDSSMQFTETTSNADTGTRTGRDQTVINTGKDSTISTSFGASGNENLNFGADANTFCSYDGGDGQNGFYPFRTLIAFDLSGIDANAEIDEALMKLNYHFARDTSGNEATISVPLTLKAHRITRSWVEGTGTWDGPNSDGSTWNNYDTSSSWSTPGGDFVAASTVEASTPTSYGWTTWDVTSFVKDWVAETNPNHGLILLGSAQPAQPTLKDFYSFNAPNADNRPKLELTLTTNHKPIAIIDSIDPSPARELVDITFTGHGTDDEDTDATSGYLWTAQKVGGPIIDLGTQASITSDTLTHGTYTVGFKVKDSEGAWSDVATQELVVEPDEPPAEIDDLEAEPHGSLDGAINLTWTAVAEDGDSQQGKADSYIIKYKESEILSEASFENADHVPNKNDIPDPGNPGSDEAFTVTGLTSGTEYFFAIVALDEAEQQGAMSDVIPAFAPDHNPPGAINDLEAIPGEEDGEVELEWTAPGDDGVADSFSPTRTYIIKCSREEIEDLSDLENAFDMPNKEDIPNPDFPGTKESLMVEGLESGKMHNFTIMAVDESGNIGLLSNIATAIAMDLTPPPALTGITAVDTPDDGGKSITVSWIPTTVDDFDHYSIFVSRTTISDIDSTIPDKTVNVRSTSTATVTTVGGAPLSDWTKYYVVVVAVDRHDNYDEKMVADSCCGPVVTVNNLERPQPLLDPEAGITQGDDSLELTPNELVEVEITKVNISLLVTELNDRDARITYTYNIEVTASAPGGQIDHIDLYLGVKDKSSDMEWSPLMDVDNLENLFPEDPRYWDDYYALFISLVLDDDVWSLKEEDREYTAKVKKEDVPGGMSHIGEAGREYKLIAVAWTETYEWNRDEEEYDLDKVTEWDVDDDDDGLPDGWEEIYFDNIELSGPLDDPDGDGFSNSKEYKMGTDPNNAESHPAGEPDIKKASGDEGGVPTWLIVVIIIFVVLGLLLVAAIIVVKKRRDRDVPQGPPVAPRPVQQPAWPQQQQKGPPGPPRGGPPGPPRGGPPGPPRGGPPGPPAAHHPPKASQQQEFPEHVKQEYQKVQKRAAEIQSELPQTQNPEQRQALIQEYQQLQQQVKQLQQKMQGEQSTEQTQLPAGPSAQKALPPGPSAEQAEIQEADAAIEKAMEEVEAEASAEPAGTSGIKPVLIECHVCGATNVVSTSERPTVVACSSCGEQGYLTE